MPVWVDDHRIAYLDDRSGVAHLFVGNISTGERRQLTSGVERIQSLFGAAGTSSVIVGTDAGGNERQQLAVIDLDTGSQRLLTTNTDRIHEPYLLSADGTMALYRTNDGASGEFSLYAISAQSGQATRLWDDAGQVRAHAMNDDGAVLASLLTANLDADLYRIDADGTRTPLLQSNDESWIFDASFGPDGDVLLLTNAGSDYVRLARIGADGELRPLVEEEWDIESFSLSPDGSTVAWSVNRDGYSVVRIAPLAALDQVTEAALPEGVADRLSWSPDGAALAVGWTPTTGPARIYTVSRDGSATTAFPEEQDDADFTGAAPELIHFETFDGRQVPAFWFQADVPSAPVVIDVHGGPESQRRPGFHPVLQYLVASGFSVLTTNVRGSTGYGKAYSHLDDVERRMDSVADLPHARAWVEARLSIPEPKIGIMGQSYGGFMTLAAVTEYPELWYAAVDVVGIANFVTFLERTGPWRRRHRSAEYGTLENHRDLLERISPIRKVDAIASPMLVIHGRNDPRVPLYEAEQLVASLKEREHPVELLVFDNEGHGLAKRPNRIAGYARVAEFFHAQADGASAE